MAKSNEIMTMKGNPLKVEGKCLEEGMPLPSFKLTGVDMTDVTNEKVAGKVTVLLSVPSLDTPVCAIETKRFNQEAAALSKDVVVLAVSRDLPFAAKRYCAAEGVESVLPLSDYKYREFGKSFGVELPDLALLGRAVFVADKSGKLVYVDYVSEVADEPNYAAVIAAVKSCM
jgi:thiol peroxidase